MTQDHNDIYSIVERLAILEGRITPTTVKHGLNKQQKSVPQLPALFNPKHISVLKSKTDPEHPMHDYAVGAEEGVEHDEPVLEAEMAEDVLEKVKKSFTDFIKHVEDEIKDSDLKDKKREDSDLKAKDKKDRDLISRVAEDPTENASNDEGSVDTPTINPVMPESKCVKSYPMEDGIICEIHGNEHDGFEIRRGTKSLPTKFKDIDQAEIALKMFQHRRRKRDEAQDYIDEA